MGALADRPARSPWGPVTRTKLRTADPLVPVLVTAAVPPKATVVTLPTVTVAADPVAPVAPWGPVLPGMRRKSKIAEPLVPVLVTGGVPPAVPEVRVPTARVAA